MKTHRSKCNANILCLFQQGLQCHASLLHIRTRCKASSNRTLQKNICREHFRRTLTFTLNNALARKSRRSKNIPSGQRFKGGGVVATKLPKPNPRHLPVYSCASSFVNT